ncbi:SoxR reducing system RseC family protein [Streptomyces sp. SID13031]|uniref:SoxR reducing system RseC family protein n=1 Tax=Streptomyces sp. SID13031 TaxID=2706046 RepID=UPI0013CC9AFE|nr:SoxR reducing system RseC family protein [Streptomyces sp. SID13031]NEA36046.1 SoxR reducing system RseC family protein [Streptomyces sp. SID13031]
MARFLLPVAFFVALAVGVGFLMSGSDLFDWGMALGLFGLALAGEGLRFWIRRDRAKARQSSEI